MQLRRTTWRNAILFLGALFLAPTAVTSSAGKDEQKPEGKTLEIKGYAEAYEKADLYAKITGYVDKWTVDIGDRVRKGQLLAKLAVPELEQEYQQKKAQLAQAEVGVEQARRSVQVLEAAIKGAKSQIEETEAGLKHAAAELERWTGELKRITALHDSKVIDKALVDETRKSQATAEARVRQAEAKIKVAEAEQLKVAAQRERALADVQAAQVGVLAARADMGRVQALLQYADIVAPFDGVVIYRGTDVGNLARPPTGNQAKPLFTVARLDVIRVVVQVPEADALAIRPGNSVIVRFPFKGPEIPAKVTRMAMAIDKATATMRVEIDINNADARMVPGMSVNVVLKLLREEPKK
jgi:HlyD family secretion protein